MIKNYLFLLSFLVFYLPVQANEQQVLVSVAPYVTMVNALAGDHVEVQLLVPAGYSSHTFEPTPRQILKAAKARLWFTIGEPFETKAITALQSDNSALQTVDLREGLELLNDSCHHHHHSSDPHIWMSPKMMETQVKHIAKALQEAFPDIAAEIAKNVEPLINRLQTLDKTIREMLSSKKGNTLFVSHPAYGYFCREYDLTQVSIEFEGKDPSPKKLTKLIDLGKELKVKTIFVQKQYSSKAAELVAQEIGATTDTLDPYGENYFENMPYIASQIAKELP